MDDPAAPSPRFHLVALVASAGGLAALTAVLSGLPGDFPAAVVVVQHLDPGRPSLLAKLLAQHCGLPVKQARQGDRLRPGAVFVAPPDRHLVVGPDAVLALTTAAPVHYTRPTADVLLESVGRGFGPRAVAVVLSGAGSDGADGVRLVKQMGGTVIAQDRPTSQSYGMPGAAIHTGCVDAVLPLGEIAPALVRLVAAGARDRVPSTDGAPPLQRTEQRPMNVATHDPEFEHLLEYLRHSRGFDFTGYKRNSLMRRVARRMQSVGATSYSHYLDYLEVHPEEFGRLFDTILINVTAFFRDPSAWEAIGAQVIPRILDGKRPGDPIRIWSAGCASGEEAYTLAMVLAEALGIDQFRDRAKIYATDVDEEALSRARQASYGEREVHAIPAELMAKYFEENNGRFSFHKELRRSVIFGRHDLIQDAPISRIDLLSCRNTLMYLNAETQARILERFHFALHDRGFLFLGKAETLLTSNSSFVPVDLKRRIFAKVARGNLGDRLLVMARTGNEEAVNHLVGHVRIRESAFDACPVPQIVVDFGGTLSLANERARTLFNLAPTDLGRPLQDLQLSYRPAELRSCIDRAYTDRRAVVVKDVAWSLGVGDASYFDVHITPLMDAGGSLLGAGITFVDNTAAKHFADEHQRSTRELETAYEELQSTNEELETTNEELQSTVEELETTSEELQSTNEELETMNEELQSTNEELETVNDELRRRGDELKRVNTFLEAILASLRGGVVVVDADFLILVWNQKAEDLWGLRPDEVRGRNLLNLDIGLPVVRLKPALLACLSGEAPHQELHLEATNRRGRAIVCRVLCTPMNSAEGGIIGAILLMSDEAEAEAGAETGAKPESTTERADGDVPPTPRPGDQPSPVAPPPGE